MAHPDNNHHVDITDLFDVKLATLSAHASQTAHVDDLESRLREWYAGNAVAAGLGGGRLAERFFVVSTA
jgi:LmbE family N-acetylglucosaminyl deacetylase